MSIHQFLHMWTYLRLSCVTSSLLFAGVGLADTIALLPVSADGCTQSETDRFQSILFQELRRQTDFQAQSLEETRETVASAKSLGIDCKLQSAVCAAEIGVLADVEWVVFGQIHKGAHTRTYILGLINVEQQQVVNETSGSLFLLEQDDGPVIESAVRVLLGRPLTESPAQIDPAILSLPQANETSPPSSQGPENDAPENIGANTSEPGVAKPDAEPTAQEQEHHTTKSTPPPNLNEGENEARIPIIPAGLTLAGLLPLGVGVVGISMGSWLTFVLYPAAIAELTTLESQGNYAENSDDIVAARNNALWGSSGVWVLGFGGGLFGIGLSMAAIGGGWSASVILE
jgi:hypothetical protein